MKKQSASELFLWRKRENSRLAKIRKKREEDEGTENQESGYTFESDAITLLNDVMPTIIRRRHIQNGIVAVPATFSIFDDPESALIPAAFVAGLARCGTKLNQVIFDHSRLKEFDLVAESILDLVSMEYERERRPPKKKLKFKGVFPNDESAGRFIRGVGIIKNLDVTHEQISENSESQLKMFRMASNRFLMESSVRTSDHKERVVKQFVDYVNRCLSVNSRKLTKDAVVRLVQYTGEILDNAEEHSGTYDWNIAGYLDTMTENDPVCEIAIFNIGRTIAETYQRLDKSSFAWNNISPYISGNYPR